jgi:CHAD domain-containing protein
MLVRSDRRGYDWQMHGSPPALSLPDGSSSPLCDYMDELVESLRKLAPAALQQFDKDSIHQARVATRRLKAATDLLRSVLSDEQGKPFARAGRKLRRRLGPMRDLDVMIDHLQMIQKRATHRIAAAWLQGRLVEARETARTESLDAESPNRVLAKLGHWWGLRMEVIQAKAQAHSLLAQALHLQLDAFADQATQLGDKESKAKHDPHQVRITGKALRYTLEMAKREGHAIPGGVSKAFKRMQESLGTWHDFVVLTERAMRESLDGLLAHHDMQLQRQVLDLSRMTLDRARKELDHFSALWAQEGPELLRTIHAAVPLAHPVAQPKTITPPDSVIEPAPLAEPASITEPKTDPDPTGSVAEPVPESSPATDREAV